MPKVMITPEALRESNGPEVKVLQDAGFEVVYPRDPHFARGNGGEPVVKHDMELRRDGPRGEIQDKRNCAGVLVGKTNIHGPLRPGFPARYLVAVGDGLRKHVHRTTPNMKVMVLVLFPSGPRKHVMRRQAIAHIWYMIVQKHSMLHCHRPKRRVRCLGPVDRRVQHHGSGDRHDRAD